MTRGAGRIVPRNLTAQAAYPVAGNPTVSRPEDAVANCFPGLEVDVRNLDRRFFPGLVFDIVSRNDFGAALDIFGLGARLSYLDPLRDPDLQVDEGWARNLFDVLTSGEIKSKLTTGIWFLEWIEQDEKKIYMYNDGSIGGDLDASLEGLYVWRIIRSLDPDEKKKLRIGLKRRDEIAPIIELEGRRRKYTDPRTGVINGAYQPGELMQSLCSPWQHDFQECLCHYWASNHPDVVFGEIVPGEPMLPGGAPRNPERANTRLDWLRANRSPAMAAAAFGTTPANRPFRMDHHEINRRWQELNVVIDNREIGDRYVPPRFEQAEPLRSIGAIVRKIRRELAPLEMALAIEYLYARFSILTPEEVEEDEAASARWPTLKEDVTFVRQQLMLLAVSEMQHLHWANQLLWEFLEVPPNKEFQPVLKQASEIPAAESKLRAHELRRLQPSVLRQFIEVEQPSCLIDGAYAKVLATLRSTANLKRGVVAYPAEMIDLVERIALDGMHHESQLLHIQARLKTYAAAKPRYPYLRRLRVGTPSEAKVACDLFSQIVDNLRLAYRADTQLSAKPLADARKAMNKLLEEGDRLAKKGIGIPFWPWPPKSPASGRTRRGRKK